MLSLANESLPHEEELIGSQHEGDLPHILIVRKQDGTYDSTPFSVKFGRKSFVGEPIDVIVNGEFVQNIDLVLNSEKVVIFSKTDGASSPDNMGQLSQVARMKLIKGENIFFFRAAKSRIAYRVVALVWNFDAKIVISDIDGTITRSNVLGLVSHLGFNWTHSNVSTFFQRLYNHGYKIVYLTARSVRLNTLTRKYLKSMQLPPGPIFSSLTSIGGSMMSELWTRDSKINKVAHLEDILKLFPNSFVAAFGNNEQDHWSYSQVKIPSTHIFIINKDSQIVAESRKTSYEHLLSEIEIWFPKLMDDNLLTES